MKYNFDILDNMGYQKRLNGGVHFVSAIPRTIIGKIDRQYFKNLVKGEVLTKKVCFKNACRKNNKKYTYFTLVRIFISKGTPSFFKSRFTASICGSVDWASFKLKSEHLSSCTFLFEYFWGILYEIHIMNHSFIECNKINVKMGIIMLK